MKLSCQEQLLPGDSLEAKWEFATGAGFAGIELRARGDGQFAARLPELRAAASSGVVMATVCPETDHFIGDFDAGRRRDAVDQLRSQLSVVASLGGAGVLTPASWGMFSLRLPPFAPPRQPTEDRKVLLEALAELAGHAAAEGVWLADEVERATGHGSVRVCADLFHMNIEEDDLAAAIRAAGPRIAHVHVDDTNRLQPGTGHMDFAGVLAALREVGYDDWLTFECRLRGEPEEALPASVRFLSGFLGG